jgi:hypothetical protein
MQGSDDWIVQDSEDHFSVLFDARTGALRLLAWSAAPRSAPLDPAEGHASGRPRLDTARAATATRHILRRLGIPNADGPWRVAPPLPGSASTVQRVYMQSSQWSVWSVIDPRSAELRDLQIMRAPESPGAPTPRTTAAAEDR